ncbi:DUF2975 domain-containing protein [Mucilaginibacter segetis]|uniref:DUF2975 domain-containing protein n=1 Tax=Mucilaginibacter segetis TaxID=2793071 RepID=A0A934UMH4_9SPHI|nr:DUF2975 domain-containing protein [Mucilaginibacter segetis]MBK0379643.1 DUF2975 domain-containing protein [Mucilaginibacter segetis]
MKVKINTNFLVNSIVTIIVILLLIYFAVIILGTSQSVSDDIVYVTEDYLKPIEPVVSDSLPYSEYKELSKKAEKIRDLKNGDWLHFGGIGIAEVIGTGGAMYCDTCTMANTTDIPGVKQDYILLHGWTLKPESWIYDDIVFHIENGQSYIRKTVKDKRKYGFKRVDVPVKFRYSRTDDCLMIPISSSLKMILNIVLGVIEFSIFIYMFYLIAAFLKFIVDISKGLPFTDSNLRRLKLIAVSLIAFPIITFLLNYVVRVIFNNYFTPDVAAKIGVWGSWWRFMITGIIFLMLFKAFKQGKTLKEEQDLTI